MHLILRFSWAIVITATAAPGFAAGISPLPFRPQVVDDTVGIGYGLAIADVDGDNRDDILLADAREIVWYRNPAWEKFVMARELTVKDNVCIAARDIDGDGKAEVAVGAGWNPNDTVGSGAIFFLERPQDPTSLWHAVRLPHEPTTHRMHWIKTDGARWLLAVLPLHGRGNKGGSGEGIVFQGYAYPASPAAEWLTVVLNRDLHLAHNFDLLETSGAATSLLVAAKEGVQRLTQTGGRWSTEAVTTTPAGEVRRGRDLKGGEYVVTIEPMHGNQVWVTRAGSSGGGRTLLDDSLIEGHALATGDLLAIGHDQIVVGWRGSAARRGQKVGIKLYAAAEGSETAWTLRGLIDDNTMACEDLKLADLNGDLRLDVIAAGRATKNLVIYWNETP